jgi:hypothetical protein
MLRSVICTCPPILENRIIPLTYGDALMYKASRLPFASFIRNKTEFVDNEMTYADLRFRLLC